MPHSRLFVLLLLLATAQPGRLSAQRWVPDTTVRLLEWGSVEVLIGADDTAGVKLWAETSPQPTDRETKVFISRFDPAGMKPWLDRAHFIVTYGGHPDPRSAGDALATTALRSVDGSQLQLVRLRKKSKWDDHASLVFRRPDGSRPWAIRASLKEAEAFIEVLFAQASHSRLTPAPMLAREMNPFLDSTASKPPRIEKAVEPHFPPGLLMRGHSGQAWVSFIVLEDGTVDPGSFRAMAYDDTAFVTAAVNAIVKSRFKPGTVCGEPVPVRTEVRVIFLVRG